MAQRSPPFALSLRPSKSNMIIQLCQAAAGGKCSEVVRLLDAGIPVDAKEINAGWTALHRAVQQGHIAVVHLLIERGANTSAPGPGGLHPLHVAISTRDASMARILLDHGAVRSLEITPTGGTAFHLAVSTGSEDLVNLLIEKGANPKATIKGPAGLGESAIHMAVASWNEALIPLLLSKGLDVNTAGLRPAGQTALHIAAWYGYEEAARVLLNAGANISARYTDGRTALHRAAEHGHIHMVNLLLERGADLMACSEADFTPLCAAAAEGKTKCLAHLLEKATNTITEEQKGRVMMSAAAADNIDSIAILLNHGCHILASYKGLTGLEIAVYHKAEKSVIFLLRRWPSSIQGDKHRELAVQFARSTGQARIAGLIKGTVPLLDDTAQNLSSPLRVDGDSVAWTIALDSTLASRRRIVANPSTAGLPPIECHTCFDLTMRRGASRDREVMHVVAGTHVASASANGCPGCTMLQNCISKLADIHGEELSSFLKPDRYFTLQSMVKGGPLYATIGKGPSAEIYSHPGSPTIWSDVGIANDVLSIPWSNQRKDYVKRLLQDCQTKHSKCSHNSSRLPTRVIDVGSNIKDQPRLHISNGDVASYVTLSHCWGGSSPATTTTTSLEIQKHGIRLESLPKTFKDAIIVTRDLGVRFLWIDSLCILQDSAEDWEREAADMSNVYANCYVMLAADGSSNCHGGLFPLVANDGCFSIPAEGPGGRKSRVYCRLTNILADDRGEVCHRLHDTRSKFKPCALDTRGWTLQERVLAPKTLHFGASEIGWECVTQRVCECQIVPTQLDTDSRFKTQLIKSSTAQNENGEMKRWLWSNIVEQFTRRHLTMSSDLLPALSGMARFMSPTAESDYVCGMWRDKLAGFLMWEPDYDYIRAHSLTDVPRRHDGHYAPSWSWASVISPVSYAAHGEEGPLSLDGDMWSKPYPISKGELSWKEQEGGEVFRVLDVHIVQAGFNPFGPPRSAILTVKGLVAKTTYIGTMEEKPTTSTSSGQLLVGSADEEGSSLMVNFTPDVPKQYNEVKEWDELLILIFSRNRGLVLKSAIGQPEENYRRVGTCYSQGEWGNWSTATIERTLRLV